MRLFDIDPFKEYEARNRLPEGLLRNRKERGKIPFDQALEKADIFGFELQQKE